MSHIETKRIVRDTPGPDVVKWRAYIAKEGETLDMQSTYAEIYLPALEATCPDDFPEGTFDDDKIRYQIGIVDYDAQGNYSDMLELDPYPFDFIPPSTPTGGRVE